MPIGIEQFEEGEMNELRATGRTNAEDILAFLASNPDQADLPTEIHEKTGVAHGSVGVVLSRFEERDLVRHRGEYWAIGNVVDVDTTLRALATARAATDRLGPEDPEEWESGIESEGR